LREQIGLTLILLTAKSFWYSITVPLYV